MASIDRHNGVPERVVYQDAEKSYADEYGVDMMEYALAEEISESRDCEIIARIAQKMKMAPGWVPLFDLNGGCINL